MNAEAPVAAGVTAAAPAEGSTACAAAPAAQPCSGCNGVGSIIVSLCCGRGCATCVGDQMQAVECYGCRGTGLRSLPAR